MSWKVDGLWPDYNDGTWPACCTRDNFDEKEVIFFPFVLTFMSLLLLDGLACNVPALATELENLCKRAVRESSAT